MRETVMQVMVQVSRSPGPSDEGLGISASESKGKVEKDCRRLSDRRQVLDRTFEDVVTGRENGSPVVRLRSSRVERLCLKD